MRLFVIIWILGVVCGIQCVVIRGRVRFLLGVRKMCLFLIIWINKVAVGGPRCVYSWSFSIPFGGARKM